MDMDDLFGRADAVRPSVIQVSGTHNTAKCYCDDLDDKAERQILALCDMAEFASSAIRVMPDVHAGMGCTIGTTMTIADKVVPGMVGVDIGCGILTVEVTEGQIDFKRLDDTIRRYIPSGRKIRQDCHTLNGDIDLEALRCTGNVDLPRARRSIGTLGGGNHFIEVDTSEAGALFLVVHSGSRHLGKQVAEHYQSEARRQLGGDSSTVPRDMAYVTGELFNDYIHDMKIIQRFAALNRKAMVDVILERMGLTERDSFTTIHNYIDTDEMVLRKGAVSAKLGERLLIPINMRDGSLICKGLGNDDWNRSAPHGAGRLMSRTAALQSLSLDDYAAEMSRAGVFTTCVGKSTLDEAPMAYKSMESIVRNIAGTAEIILRISPIYNFKAGE